MFRVNLRQFLAMLSILIFQASLLQAQENLPAAVEPDQSFAAVFMQMLPVYALVIAVYYLLVLKPQQKKQAAQQELKTSLKKGDNVLTSSGIVGKVVSIEDDFFNIEIAPNTKIKIMASHIVGKPGDGKTADKTSTADKSSQKAVSNS